MVSAKLLSAALLFALVAGQQNNNQNQNGQNNNGQNNGQNNNGQNNGQNNNGQNGQNNNNNGQNNNNQNGQNNNQNNGQNNQATATINANALQTGSFFDGTDALGASDEQVASETSQENFINFCAGQTLTNGLQIIDGSCNGIPMGQIPAKNKMVSTVVLSPQTGQILPAGVDFEIIVQVSNLQAGAFTNAVATYYSAPQRLNGQGIIIGHTHVTVQDIGDNMNPQNPPNPEFFAFFKGINDAGNGNGQLKADVPGGLPAGNYRVCTLTSNSNHAPVVMPVAQRGAQDDCTKFVVSDNAAADQAAQNAQNGQDQNGQNGQNNNQTGQNQNGQNNGQNGQQNGQNQNGQNQNGQNNGQNNQQNGQNQNGQNNGQNNQQNGQNQNGQNNQQNGQQNAQNNGQQNGQNSADAARQAAERQRQQTEQQRQQQQAEAQRQQQERQRQQQQQQQQQQGKKVRRTDGGSARFSRRAFVA